MYAENEYMGRRKARLWTYMIAAMALVLGALAVNFALTNPELAEKGIETFLGMPRWGFPLVGMVVGTLIYSVGLKIETDWPEALGALMVAGSVAAGEVLIGWNRFALGGLVVLPYAIPVLVFVVMMMMGTARSK